jgi:hypothetical protein
MPHPSLSPLPYADWKATKTTLHLMSQIVGKIRLGHVPHRSHWWNVTLQPTPRGLTTMRMRQHDVFFEIEFDFVDHQLSVRSSAAHKPVSFSLHDGMSVARFYAALFAALEELGLRVSILDKPYRMGVETPFSTDNEHASYDRVMVRRWWEAMLWSADVFDQFAADFLGKESPAHLFWHSFDLALARYSGSLAGGAFKPDPVEREAYSCEVIAVGFWPGDDKTPAPTYYTYTAPEPADLTKFALQPSPAAWYPQGAGHLGALPYDTVRESDDPRATLMQFLRGGFEAGTRTAHWNLEPLLNQFHSKAYKADAVATDASSTR